MLLRLANIGRAGPSLGILTEAPVVFTSLNRPDSTESAEEKYPALRIVLMIWKALVVVQVIVTIGVVLFAWLGTKDSNSVGLGLLILLGGFLSALIQWSLAEFVAVVMDI